MGGRLARTGTEKGGKITIMIRFSRSVTSFTAASTASCSYLLTGGRERKWVGVFIDTNGDLDAVSSVHQNNLTRSAGLVERDNVVGQTERRSIVISGSEK